MVIYYRRQLVLSAALGSLPNCSCFGVSHQLLASILISSHQLVNIRISSHQFANIQISTGSHHLSNIRISSHQLANIQISAGSHHFSNIRIYSHQLANIRMRIFEYLVISWRALCSEASALPTPPSHENIYNNIVR